MPQPAQSAFETRGSSELARAEQSQVPAPADSLVALEEREAPDRARRAMVMELVAVLELEEPEFGKFRVRRVGEPAADPTRQAVGATPRRECGEEAGPRGAVRARWRLKPA